jgi:hypothetical protein
MKYETEHDSDKKNGSGISVDKTQLEIEKLAIERDKLKEELKQLQVPFFRKPAYLSVFLPVCVTLIAVTLQYRRVTNEQSVQEKKELRDSLAIIRKERDEVLQEKSEINIKRLAIEQLILQKEKKDIEERIAVNEKKLIDQRILVADYQAKIEHTYALHDVEKRKLVYLNDSLQSASAELNSIIQHDSTNLLALQKNIKEKEHALKNINQKVTSLTVQAKLLSKVSKDLKGLMLRFYTNWSSNNKDKEYQQLRDQLINTRTEISDLFTQLGTDHLRPDFEDMDRAIQALINDKGAFRKIRAIDNVNYVKKIEEKSNLLIEKLEKEV